MDTLQALSATRRPAWSMTVNGDWVRLDESGSAQHSGLQDEIEKVLAHARKLPPKEADEFLSQDFVMSILRAGGGQRQSDRVLQVCFAV